MKNSFNYINRTETNFVWETLKLSISDSSWFISERNGSCLPIENKRDYRYYIELGHNLIEYES
jgi:hypothetical protein